MSPLSEPFELLRRTLERDARGLLIAEPLSPELFVRTPSDPGLFTSDSVIWRVHADRSALVGGLRALLLQSLHPVAMAAVAQHSSFRDDLWGRLRRTGAFLGVTTFGSTSAAERAIEQVRRVHARITGTTADGRPYRADDPHLLAWIHATEVDSFLRAYRRYGAAPLSAEDGDRYVAEMAEVGRRLGVVDPPRAQAALRRDLIAFRAELAAGDDARQAVRFLLWPPLPASLRAPYGVLFAAAAGLLPGFVRRELRLPLLPLADPVIVQPAAKLLLGAMGAVLDAEPPATRLVDVAETEAAETEAARVGSVSSPGSTKPAARRSRPAAPEPNGRAPKPAPTRGQARPTRSAEPTAGARRRPTPRPVATP